MAALPSPAGDEKITATVEPQLRVWDLPVRLFHWSLVGAFSASYITNKLGVTWFRYHVWSGYAVIVLVTFRILWGFIGTRHARFSSFVRSPAATLRYVLGLKRGEHGGHAGHNPLGGLMVLALLLALLVQALSGLFSNDEIVNVGPLYGYVSNERSLWATSLHRLLFDWIFTAVVIHVLAVLAHQVLRKEPLIRAMFNGRKPARLVSAKAAIHSSRLWLALPLLALLCAMLAWVVMRAPPAELSAF